jgi:pimeloyl-ACP methyl ester carboxylesterase
VADRTAFELPVDGGVLGGWTAGSGTPVLLLHGGPGLSYSYLGEIEAELGSGVRLIAYQQRGLSPSTREGPFTIAQALLDAIAVLDGFGAQQALVVGHSWGGQLALRLAAAAPERVLGALAIDLLGIVGDGGMAGFEAEMLARTPKSARERARELDQRAMAGEGTPEEGLESLRIVWPAYFADPDNAPPMPPVELSVEAYAGIITQVADDAEQVAAELSRGLVPYGVVAGAASPMPWGQAARATVELSPRAFLELVPAAGHFPWYEVPGCVRAALERLAD